VNGISIRLSLPRLSTDICKLRIIWTPNTEPATEQFDDESQIYVGRRSMGVVRKYWSEILSFAKAIEASCAKFGLPAHRLFAPVLFTQEELLGLFTAARLKELAPLSAGDITNDPRWNRNKARERHFRRPSA
jgi:hypothetical protein